MHDTNSREVVTFDCFATLFVMWL